jgi:hypothetical protein
MNLDFSGRESAWKFVTSSGFGVSLEVAATGGKIVLRNPQGKEVNFYYGAVGAGLSTPSLKLPKLGKLKKSGGGSAANFPSKGAVYMLSQFQGKELAESDLQGGCVFIEGAGGLLVGAAADAMLLGGNPVWLLMATNPGLAAQAVPPFLKSCKAVLLMAGLNAGLQASIGVTGYAGYLR